MSDSFSQPSAFDRLTLIGTTGTINDIGRFARECILHQSTNPSPDATPRSIWDVSRPEEDAAIYAKYGWAPDEMRDRIVNFRAQTQEVFLRAVDPLQLTRHIAEVFYGIDIALHEDYSQCPAFVAQVAFASTGPTSSEHFCTPATAELDWTENREHTQSMAHHHESDQYSASEEESGPYSDEEGGSEAGMSMEDAHPPQ